MPFGSKELSRAYGLKGKNAIWVKRVVYTDCRIQNENVLTFVFEKSKMVDTKE